jgi:hypothetical protein
MMKPECLSALPLRIGHSEIQKELIFGKTERQQCHAAICRKRFTALILLERRPNIRFP